MVENIVEKARKTPVRTIYFENYSENSQLWSVSGNCIPKVKSIVPYYEEDKSRWFDVQLENGSARRVNGRFIENVVFEDEKR